MALTIGISGPYRQIEDGVLKGARRSRFSFHLRTSHVRRWLLVQLVSVPLTAEIEEDEFTPSKHQNMGNTYQGSARNVVDEYAVRQPLHTWV